MIIIFLFTFSACQCNSLGTLGFCNPNDGKCTCKRFVMGARCDRCQVSRSVYRYNISEALRKFRFNVFFFLHELPPPPL